MTVAVKSGMTAASSPDVIAQAGGEGESVSHGRAALECERTARGTRGGSRRPERGTHGAAVVESGEVAQLLRLGRSTVFALLAASELPVIRIGRSVRVPRVALERWIEERTSRVGNHGDVQGPLVQDLGDWRADR